MKLSIPAHAPLVVTTRGRHVECVHHGSIAVVDTQGKLLAGVGDPHALNFTRSALKPLQALPFVAAGGMSRWGFGSHELALMCASHGGEPIHVKTVSRMLERIGARASDLQCGCHVPSYFAATGARPPARTLWSPLQHNCSGKHSGFLAYCRMHGQALGDYLDPQAPLQRRIRATVRGFARGGEIAMGTDGCSAPNYAMPLSSLAQAFGRLAVGDSPELASIAYAMRRHPDLVSGTARFDLALMQTGAADWISKSGADGVQAIGVASRGIGIAIRMADGNPRAMRVATVAVLRHLDLLGSLSGTALAPLVETTLRNYRGTRVGEVLTAFELAAVRA